MKSTQLYQIITFTVVNVFSLTIARAQSTTEMEQAKKAILASNAVYHTSFTKNDSTIFLNSYTDDARIVPPKGPVISGRSELTHFFRGGYKAGARSGRFITTKLYGDGKEYVTEEGIGKVFDGSGRQMGECNYLVIWKKTDKGWKMYRDMFVDKEGN
jgi:ketosteroid isomerase-like protein